MKFNIYWIGRTKNESIVDLTNMYLSRLKHYAQVEIYELNDIKLKNKKLPTELLKEQEAQLFLSKIDTKHFLIVLDERGKQMSSVSFSQLLDHKKLYGHSTMNIVIGGAFGVHIQLSKKANLVLSLSLMTFTHDMCRIILLEQLYRALTISKGEKYHNT